MKPTWDKAPERANWLAQDSDGKWWWHENEPKYGNTMWIQTGEVWPAWIPTKWNNTLEARPK
jgi:hypothetical protein